VHGHADLLQIVAALRPSGSLPGRLDRRQQQRHKNANNGNDNQKLHQGESTSLEQNHDQSSRKE